MSAKSNFAFANRVSELVSNIEKAGMRLEIDSDFSEYGRLRARQAREGRSAPYPMFDSTSSFVDETNGFWIAGFDKENTLVHTQAVCLFDMGASTLADHLSTHREKYVTPNSSPDPSRTTYHGPNAIQSIAGRVCYQGDFWVRSQGLGGSRSQGLTNYLSQLLIEVAYQTWKFDFIFALLPKGLAQKGVSVRYGYAHGGWGQWIGPDQQITEEDYFVWMTGQDVSAFSARRPIVLPDSLSLSDKDVSTKERG